MQITIRLLAHLRLYLPEDHEDPAGYRREITAGTRVGELLATLPVPEGHVYTFFVNGRHAERNQILQAGDVLSVFPAAGGG